MREHLGKAVGISAIGLGLLAFMIAAPSTSPLYGLTTSDPNAQGSGDSTDQNMQGTQNAAPATGAQGMQGAQNPAQATVTSQDVDATINNWPDEAKQDARKMIDKYGQPNGALADRLIWVDNGPFKQTVVLRDGVEHNFPTRHMDYIQQTIAYKVPVNKVGELERFDGSLSFQRTRGLLSAESNSEENNFLALNLANDIVTGKKTVDQARKFYARTVQLELSGRSSPELEGLDFSISGGSTGDPDRPVGRAMAAPQPMK